MKGAVAAAVLFAAVGASADAPQSLPTWVVDGNCRDGEPQGPYQLRATDGQLRAVGAFNDGKRTSSFIFWSRDGVRAAHIPYDDGVRNGTVATWYAGEAGREPPRRFESAWRQGRRDGLTRSWYADGHRRSETEYAAGEIVRTIGWSDTGERLSDAAARDLARREEAEADAEYDGFDRLVREHLPRCD